jgi:hypothetical protein
MAMKANRAKPLVQVTIKLDAELQALVRSAAKARGLSLSEHIRQILRTHSKLGCDKIAGKEIVSFWKAVTKPSELTPSQRRLGAIMRGEL